ncbi:MAG: DUF4276 family protein, partial [Sandaracinaceae bacterium]|nr:DUF4276 family protein [Sandaracinaceae bacterium]
MTKLLILVEGQTEETFVRNVLGPHLSSAGLTVTSVILKTKRVKAGGHFRGGVTSSSQVVEDIRRLLHDTSATAVTTLIDYYGLPPDFPGMSGRPPGPPHGRVAHVEAALARVIADPRFIPHLALHELEAWIYAAPSSAEWVFEAGGVASQLEGMAATAGGPELVDDGPTTAPSKRLLSVFPGYQKTLHGPMAVEA